MSSQTQYFGFDDDATVSTSCIQKPSPIQPKVAPKKVTPETEQLSISQIQALLCQDLTSLDGSTNLSTNETSFYIDEVEVTNAAETLTETFEEEFSQGGTSTIIEQKVERRPRKVLGNIENKSEAKSCKTYKKTAKAATKAVTVSFIAKKEEKPTKPAKKRKTKKENENDENFDKFAELINKQFAQVESFQLHVE